MVFIAEGMETLSLGCVVFFALLRRVFCFVYRVGVIAL